MGMASSSGNSRGSMEGCWETTAQGLRKICGAARPAPAALPQGTTDLVNDIHQDLLPRKDLTHLIRSPSEKSFPAKYAVTKKSLGSGMSGSVMMAKVILSDEEEKKGKQGFDVAVKVLPTATLTDLQREQLLSEVCNQLNMDHPNICKLLEIYVEPKCMRLVIERMRGPNLLDHLNSKGEYKQQDAANAVHQMLKAVAYIHSKGVIHRDLKLENFCLEDKSPNARIKMIDFGLSDKVKGQPLTHACGSLLYVAPEVLKKKYTEKADMWSMGVITFALLFGQPPFDGIDDRQLCDNILRGKLKFPRGNVSATAKFFIESLLNRDADLRLSAKDALKHQWFKCLEDGHDEDEKLDMAILQGMRRLQRSNGLKQALLSVLAPKATAKEVSKWASEFEHLDDEGTGMVSISDLADRLVKVSDCSSSEADEIAQCLAALGDDDDKVSYSAFLAACLSSNMAMLSEKDLEGVLKNMDKDGDKHLTPEELKKAFEGIIPEEDFPEGELSFKDVQWLLLGPRWCTVETTQDELEKLLSVNGVTGTWKIKTKKKPRGMSGSPLEKESGCEDRALKAKEDKDAEKEALKFQAARAENLAFRKMAIDTASASQEEINTSQVTLNTSQADMISQEDINTPHLNNKDLAKDIDQYEKSSKEAVKLVESVSSNELQSVWHSATNDAKGGDIDAIRRENLAFRAEAVRKAHQEPPARS